MAYSGGTTRGDLLINRKSPGFTLARSSEARVCWQADSDTAARAADAIAKTLERIIVLPKLRGRPFANQTMESKMW
jgi:hypothetical protein